MRVPLPMLQELLREGFKICCTLDKPEWFFFLIEIGTWERWKVHECFKKKEILFECS